MDDSVGSDQPDKPEIDRFAFKKPASTSGIKSVGFLKKHSVRYNSTFQCNYDFNRIFYLRIIKKERKRREKKRRERQKND